MAFMAFYSFLWLKISKNPRVGVWVSILFIVDTPFFTQVPQQVEQANAFLGALPPPPSADAAGMLRLQPAATKK